MLKSISEESEYFLFWSFFSEHPEEHSEVMSKSQKGRPILLNIFGLSWIMMFAMEYNVQKKKRQI